MSDYISRDVHDCSSCRYNHLEWYELPCDDCTMGGKNNHWKPATDGIFIFQCHVFINKECLDGLQKEMEEKLGEKVIVLPPEIDLVYPCKIKNIEGERMEEEPNG